MSQLQHVSDQNRVYINVKLYNIRLQELMKNMFMQHLTMHSIGPVKYNVLTEKNGTLNLLQS